jgi:rRNA-processing protein FCF1
VTEDEETARLRRRPYSLRVRVRLRPGADSGATLRLLELLASNAHNEATPAPGSGANAGTHRLTYVRWVTSLEVQLSAHINRPDVLCLLGTARNRDIIAGAEGPHLLPLISAEIDAKSQDLRAIHQSLQADLSRVQSAPGVPAVLDSNVLLQCLRPDQVRWATVVGEAARLIVPLRVIEELDAKKYGGSERLRSVARGILPWLEALFEVDGAGPVLVGDPDGSTIELLFSDSPRYRPSDADEEVLDVVDQIRSLAGRAVVVTADTGMLLRARALGVPTRMVPETFLRSVGAG